MTLFKGYYPTFFGGALEMMPIALDDSNIRFKGQQVSSASPTIKTRKNFPETWIWTNNYIGLAYSWCLFIEQSASPLLNLLADWWYPLNVSLLILGNFFPQLLNIFHMCSFNGFVTLWCMSIIQFFACSFHSFGAMHLFLLFWVVRKFLSTLFIQVWFNFLSGKMVRLLLPTILPIPSLLGNWAASRFQKLPV